MGVEEELLVYSAKHSSLCKKNLKWTPGSITIQQDERSRLYLDLGPEYN